VQIRDATIADYDAYVRLFAELGIADPIASRERFAAEIMPRTFVAVQPGGVVVGYAVYELLADVGYTRNVASDPMLRRTGIGTALMAALRARFVGAGATTWCLNVKPDNAAAIGLYERCGMSVAYRATTLRIASDVALVAPPAELALAVAGPGDDEHTEHLLHLLRGQLASARARPSRQVLHLRRGGEVVGVGVFVDSFPGAFPFRVTAPELGVPFVGLLRALAPDRPYIQVVVEDDEPLRAALLAAGAHVYLEIQHMRGSLAGAS
jgi:ribosomal protein S18 acetylase RimI-like enzyme